MDLALFVIYCCNARKFFLSVCLLANVQYILRLLIFYGGLKPIMILLGFLVKLIKVFFACMHLMSTILKILFKFEKIKKIN